MCPPARRRPRDVNANVRETGESKDDCLRKRQQHRPPASEPSSRKFPALSPGPFQAPRTFPRNMPTKTRPRCPYTSTFGFCFCAPFDPLRCLFLAGGASTTKSQRLTNNQPSSVKFPLPEASKNYGMKTIRKKGVYDASERMSAWGISAKKTSQALPSPMARGQASQTQIKVKGGGG